VAAKTKFILFAILIAFAMFPAVSLAAKKAPKPIPKSACKPSYPSDDWVEWSCHRMKGNETPEKLFGEHWEAVLRFNRIDRRHIWEGKYIKIPANLPDVTTLPFSPMPKEAINYRGYPKYVLINLKEQFIGAYEFGELKFSIPIASGRAGHTTPKGMFKVLGGDKNHESNLYKIEKTDIPYPMHWAVKFYTTKRYVSFWIHGRDLPGYPASHGCVGLYDEEMQRDYYDFDKEPQLMDAKKFYLWIFPDSENNEKPHDYPKNSPEIPVEIF